MIIVAVGLFRDIRLMGWLRLTSIDQIGCILLDCRFIFEKRQFWSELSAVFLRTPCIAISGRNLRPGLYD